MYLFSDRFLVGLVAAALAFSARAQETIIFSKPAEASADKANSFMPSTEHHSGDYNAPHQLFKDYTPDLPLPAPVISLNNDPSVKEALDKRRNWTLLTPEQILGVQTPEEIMGVPNKLRDAEKKLSLEEQFLLRTSRSKEFSATNGRAGSVPWGNQDDNNPFSLKNQNEDDPLHPSLQKTSPGARYFNQILNAGDSGNPSVGADGRQNSAWNTVFTQPTQPPATPEQEAAMERFRALMEPSSPPQKIETPTRFSIPAATTPDPFMQARPFANPNGRDVAPLEADFSKPAGITPLPPISTPPPKPVQVRPSWQAQLPPWMQSGPPAHNPNQNF